jgi:hypothetical protein
MNLRTFQPSFRAGRVRHKILFKNSLLKKGGAGMKRILFSVFIICFVFAAGASAEFSADMNARMAGMTTSSKIYYKNFDTSRTEAMGVIEISRDGKSYQLFEQTKKYVLMHEEELEQQNPLAVADSFDEFVDQNEFKKVGSEKLSGYKCDVYEGSIDIEGQPPVAMKMWYSSKLEYPVKTETQLPGGMGMAVSTLENIKVGKQPDDLFEIPAGYTQAASMQEAMGMGGFEMPSGGGDVGSGADEMPSEEEMNQMMQMMQQMMGGQE